MITAEILSRLEDVRRTTNGWEAKCPGHDDRKASLSVAEGRDGRTLLDCKAGCSADRAVKALGLELRDLFANGRRNGSHPGRSRVDATYDYVDEDGRLLSQVCRLFPKGFRQRRPDGRGGWEWRLTGTRKVLYRLPDVIEAAAAGRTIYLVEGEKDADRLYSLGLTATTNAGGAKKWRSEYNISLRDAHVVIIPDNDEPGRAHARSVANALDRITASVRVVELSGLPPKGDVSDWLDSGGTIEELHRLVGETSKWEKTPAGVEEQAAPEELDPSTSTNPTSRPGSRSRSREPSLTEVIAELNAKYFVAGLQGTTVIASLQVDASRQREHLVFTRPADLRLLYSNRYVKVGEKNDGTEIRKPWGAVWLSHPERRTFDRITLDPTGETPPGTYNMWRGWGVKPAPGAWPLICDHLLSVICSGDEGCYTWLLHWMARCVQHPELRAEVAVVLRGLKGTGKGALAGLLLRLFQSHSLPITNSRHLVGNFNAHLVDVLFLFLDEAFWAGDKAGEGTLKALITEPTILIEPKGINAFSVENRLKIIMASNADWVVPATADERRFFVLDVSSSRRGDSAYFGRLFAAIDGPELPALLHDLLSLDLSDFDHRQAPHTAALNRQKLVGGDSFTRFWHDCLTHGEVIMTAQESPRGDATGNREDNSLCEGWPDDIPVQLLHRRYVDHARQHGERHPVTDAEMGKKLAEFVPGLKKRRPRRPWGDQAKPMRYFLPGIEICRSAFLQWMNITSYEWPLDDDEGAP